MKTNMSPENWWLEDEMSFWDGPFLGDMFIFGGVPGNSAGDLFGMVICDPLKWLSDLQLGDEKVTLNHLVLVKGWFGLVVWDTK